MKKVLILMVVLVFALVGCQGNTDAEGTETEEMSNIVPVEVMKPANGSVSNDTVIVGKFSANETSIISPKIAGAEEVIELNFEVS